MATRTTPITFIVSGTDDASRAQPASRGAGSRHEPVIDPLTGGEVRHAVKLGVSRGSATPLRVQAVPGEDVVVLHLSQGPSLVLHPDHARRLMLAQAGQPKPAARRGVTAPVPADVEVPLQLQWRGLEAARGANATSRGASATLGRVLLTGLDVVGGLAKRWLTDQAADLASSQVVRLVDSQVGGGVFALTTDALPSFKDRAALSAVPAANGPLLVLVHGTFSTTAGTFGKLWGEHPDKVRRVFNHYGGRVYALDHPTLGASPVDNALALARALPAGAQLHLLTHSRGGLVAEVLARVCASRGRLDAEALKLSAGPDQAATTRALQALARVVADKRLTVQRVVRVACPARGTLLASKRLDAYLSVLKWTMELAGLAVTPALLGLLGEVARRRADPTQLPGLAAMLPDSPLVQWLHAVDEPLDTAAGGELRVIAGDLQGDSVTSWLKTLLADGFYWCDNDLVVHTASMYGGALRAQPASFLFDQGGKVSHFAYFSNERTAAAVVDGLVLDAPPGYQRIGPLSAAGQSSTGVRGTPAASPTAAAPDPTKPAVFVLPGILGSHLKKNGKRVWLSWRILGGLQQLALGPDDGVEPDGPMGQSYDALCDHLRATHEVIPFGYDWRLPLQAEARRLAQAVDAALAARADSGQPVRLLAHSMGGLLARTLQLECPDTWERLMAHADSRLLMLGTPNGGSWAPMQSLSGDDRFSNALVAFGAPLQDHSARTMMAAFPGFLQLQAGLLDANLALDRADTWQRLADDDLRIMREQAWWHDEGAQVTAYQWGVPPQAVLDEAVALRRRLDTQRQTDLPRWADRLRLVTGHARFTPDGFTLGSDGLVYLDTPDDGDGRVTRPSARLPGVRTWQADCAHGDLPAEQDAFDAYTELLMHGETTRLAPLPDDVATPPNSRGAAARVAHRPSRQLRLATRPLDPAQAWETPSEKSVDSPPQALDEPAPALRVRLLNGDLGFVAQPLVLGHYRSLALTGTEQAVDHLIGGAMQVALDAGLYPAAPGSHQVFANARHPADEPWQSPRPAAVIVVGLGDEGALTLASLALSVRQGVIAWGQRLAEAASGSTQPLAPRWSLAATLLGSGGSGISAGQAAQQVAIGVREANQRLRTAGWPEVGELTLVELYLDRAAEAWRALNALAATQTGRFDIAECVQSAPGALRRPPEGGYRGTAHDFISALPETDAHGNLRIAYTLATRRARSEVRAQATQAPLVRDLVSRAATDRPDDPGLGRTLYALLVPAELDGDLATAQSLVMELAAGTAGIPWEMLDAGDASPDGRQRDRLPWALRCRLLRKLRLTDFRGPVQDAHPGDAVLVVGEPACDATRYPELPAARAEAEAVAQALTGALDTPAAAALATDRVTLLTGSDAQEVVGTLLSRDWRIVHIAGHGEPPTEADPCGVVLSGGTFLGPREIAAMRAVPELVFVNCCHLAARSADELLQPTRSLPGFAAGVAEALMRIGVRCVVAAGWAVDDEPAQQFATTFYAQILQGRRFIDAVAEARLAAWGDGRQGHTWAAYQCYGDPDWIFRRDGADAQQPSPPIGEAFDGIASASGLTLALESLIVGLTVQGRERQPQHDRIRHLAARFGPRWGDMGAVAEAFGLAFAAADDLPTAIRWYGRAVAAADGSASMKAAEQWGHLRVRAAWEGAHDAATRRHAVAAVETALSDLARLAQWQPTLERASLCGAACKRLATLHEQLGQHAPARDALAQMHTHYQQAWELGTAGNAPAEAFYPGLNLLAAQWRIDGRLDEALMSQVARCIDTAVAADPGFWNLSAQIELTLLRAVADGSLARQSTALLSAWTDLHRRAPHAPRWRSVNDQVVLILAGVAEPAAGRRLLKALSGWAAQQES